MESYACFYKLVVLSVRALTIRALLFGRGLCIHRYVYGPPHIWNLPCVSGDSRGLWLLSAPPTVQESTTPAKTGHLTVFLDVAGSS